VISKARKEATLTLYTSAPADANAALRGAFRAVYPDIDPVIVQLTTAAAQPRIVAEYQGKTAGADVSISSDLQFQSANSDKSGFFSPITGPNATKNKDLLKYKNTTLLTAGSVLGIGYSTKAVPNGPKSFADLLLPQYKGKLGIQDYNASTIYVAQYMEWAKANGGDSFLEGLAAQVPSFFPSMIPLSQSLASGELAMALPMTPALIGSLPISVAFPGTAKPLANPFVACVLGTGAHQNAAQLFVDFMVTPEAQKVWAKGVVSVMTPKSLDSLFTIGEVQVIDMNLYDQATLDSYRTKLKSIFKR
jgi:ABC-type Fe3+ transport system substrate-binding protein